MSENTAVITLNLCKMNKSVDLYVPLDISANDLCSAIFQKYVPDRYESMNMNYLKAEKPIALLRGERTLREFGIRNGSVINITE